MANIPICDYLEGKATIEEVVQAFEDNINLLVEEYFKTHKDHHLKISIDEDDTIDDAIKK